jgi:hypothetical protein
MSGRLIRFAASLYPAWWRARYGVEFAALLEDVNPGAATVVNIVRGALLMQLNRMDLARSASASLLVGVVVAGAALFATPRHFASTLSIEWDATHETAWPGATAPDALGFTDTNLAQVIEKLGLYPEERGSRPATEIVNLFRRNISVTRAAPAGQDGPQAQTSAGAAGFRDRGLVNLSFTHPDGPTAEKVVTALGQIVVVENVGRAERNTAAQQPDRWAGVRIRITKPARHDRTSPNFVAVIGAGLGTAALAAAGMFVLRRRSQQAR